MSPPPSLPVAVEPASAPAWLREAVVAGGGSVVDPADAEALVWSDADDPDGLDAVLAAHAGIRWVQLPWAGIEPYVELVRLHPERTWTCGKGVYAEPVAEHALALALAGLRHLHAYARATGWTAGVGRNLLGARLVILGGGGIAESLLRLLGPFDTHTTVVRRSPRPMPGADAVVALDDLDRLLPAADVVVLALALTPETTGIVDRRRMDLLPEHAWIVNVARGAHVVTEDLVAVLSAEGIGGAALDVTDPEPLPAGHPLWSEPRCLITPHTGNTKAMAVPLLGDRVRENVRRRIGGAELLGPVDTQAGY